MSVCVCYKKDPVATNALATQILNDPAWDFETIRQMYRAGNSLEAIQEVIPFRDNACTRSVKCCGVCTRQCKHRCVQDCLNRVKMWRTVCATTPQERYETIPLGIRMIARQHFESTSQLSLAVGEIISRNTNSKLYKFMTSAQMRPEENPNKMYYGPELVLDPKTGNRIVEPDTGIIKFLAWPTSGLCPFCIPRITVDRRFI